MESGILLHQGKEVEEQEEVGEEDALLHHVQALCQMAVWVVFEGSSNDFGDGPKIFIGGGEGFVQPERINWDYTSEYCGGDAIPLCGRRYMLNNPTMKDVDFQFSTTPDGTHAGGTVWTTGVTKSGTEGESGAYIEVDIAKSICD